MSAKKSLKKTLTSLEKVKVKEAKLKERGDEEALKNLKQTKSWESALSKAEGQKVRTDISLVSTVLPFVDRHQVLQNPWTMDKNIKNHKNIKN
jgi:hypothetical protein